MIGGLPFHGGCNCGAVRYIITRPILTAYICHCHLCQKRTGSAFSMSVVVSAEGFDLVQGEPVRMERQTAQDTRTVAHVCPACHSRTHGWREGGMTVLVRAGTLDDTSAIRPVAQFWTESAQPWALVRDDILSYKQQPADFMPLIAAWRTVSA